MFRAIKENRKATLLIPVELQVRELDPKLLLACVAAKRGFSSVIGPRREMHFHLHSFPRSIYLSKSLAGGSNNVFRELHRLTHQIVAWDEEALVHLPPESYFQRRLSPRALQYVSKLFAWGKDNLELWRQYPEMPSEVSIHITGNPRGDLLRPEMRSLYDHDAKKIRQTYGNFILVNTNFNQVNAFYPDGNLLKFSPVPDEVPDLTRRAIGMGMSREYAAGLSKHKQDILNDFKRLIPALDHTLTDHTIVIRPHPAENPEIYNEIAKRCGRVQVTNEGNVVPWLIAAKALVHNGCTTGVEAFALGLPAISYRASINEYYDDAFHRLPNLVSHECFNLEQLQETLAKILGGSLGTANSDERKAIMEHHLAAMKGPLACERMVDIFEEMVEQQFDSPPPTIKQKWKSWVWAKKRQIRKRSRSNLPDMSHNRTEFLRHRYPGISLNELRTKLSMFQHVLGDRTNLKVKEIYHQFYRISAG